MKRFIEIRFGQDEYVQNEIIPVDSIQDMFIVLPEGRNIQISWKNGNRHFGRTEYYNSKDECYKRWMQLRKACGIKPDPYAAAPLPNDKEVLQDEAIREFVF